MTDLLKAGKKALSLGDWTEARRCFEASLKERESPEAYDGLASAAEWQHDEKTVFDSRERAYRLFLDRGDKANAAMTAVWLAMDSRQFRGEQAVTRGWLQRAHRLLDSEGPSLEKGMLTFMEALFALMERNDTSTALSMAREAARAGRASGNADLEMLATALEGLSLVSSGRVQEGMRLLDEAGVAALSGDMTDLMAIGTACCFLVDACDRVRDYDRADQWYGRIMDFTRRNNMEEMTAICRPHYAVLLMWRGAFADAEKELNTAIEYMSRIRPPMATEGVVRLADLRIRQGRYKDAAALLRQVEREPLSQLSLAELALSEGDPAAAEAMAERYLRRLPVENVVERAGGLEMMVRAKVAQGEFDAAGRALFDFEEAAASVGTGPIKAAASHAAGLLALGQGDNERARLRLEDAVDLYNSAGAVMETAKVRTALARSLHALGRSDAAAREAGLAFDTLRQVGAPREAEKAAEMLRVIASSRPSDARGESPGPDVLTQRELEVLKLIAAGKSNAEISELMVLSVRTVERHISNLYLKIGAEGKTARASATAYAYSRGLVGKQGA